MIRRASKIVLLSLFAVGLACSGDSGKRTKTGKSMLDPNDDARTGYEKALLDFRRGDCLTAQPTFEEIRREFPYSRFAALSELRIGDCQFKNEQYPEAIQTYRQFVRIRPSHKEIPYAQWLDEGLDTRSSAETISPYEISQYIEQDNQVIRYTAYFAQD